MIPEDDMRRALTAFVTFLHKVSLEQRCMVLDRITDEFCILCGESRDGCGCLADVPSSRDLPQVE